MTSKRQLAANRRNALKSTGPRSDAGKKTSRSNARKHMVFANEIVADHEDKALFDRLLGRLIEDLDPQTQIESSLVERLAATLWRERRLAIAEQTWLNREHEYQLRIPQFEDDPRTLDNSLPIAQQLLIGRYQVMLTNQARSLLDELRREQERRAGEAVEDSQDKNGEGAAD